MPTIQSGEHPLLKEYLPNLRARVESAMGIQLPGTTIRDNVNFQPGEYAISFFEIECSKRSVQKDRQFIAATHRALGMMNLDTKSAVPGEAPSSQTSGFWVDKQLVHADDLEMFEVYHPLDPYEFIIEHLEHLINQHLEKFLGIQETYNLVKKWDKALSPETPQSLFAKRLQADPQLLATSTKLFRELLKLKIPLTDAQKLLSALEQCQQQVGHAEKINYLQHYLQA